MRHSWKSSSLLMLVVVGTLFGSVLAGTALGSVSGAPAGDSVLADQYTGCLTPLGRLRRVAIGTEPAQACTAAQVEITWSEEGPIGPQGDRGRRGRRGVAGPEGPPGVVPAATDAIGSGQAVNNMSPYLGVSCIIATSGVFPSRNDSPDSAEQVEQEVLGLEPYLGEISWFAGNFAPRGWAFCDGQLLSISDNQALFSLLGTIYGGDGRTTFALPDMRGRSPMHYGSGPGLTPRRVGERGGSETNSLSTANLPSHSHTITPPQ